MLERQRSLVPYRNKDGLRCVCWTLRDMHSFYATHAQRNETLTHKMRALDALKRPFPQLILSTDAVAKRKT